VPRATGVKTQLSRYEAAWEAINLLIRAGGSWSGYERNCFFRNAPGGSFINVSAVSGLDVDDDARAIAVWDYDLDGDPDLLVKNRTAPQLRIWRNDSPSGCGRAKVRLRGTRSNRQGIGARVFVEAGGRRRVKELAAGSGFLAQSSGELFFGLGDAKGIDRLEVRWPSGAVQRFAGLPAGRAITITEGDAEARREPFRKPAVAAVAGGGGGGGEQGATAASTPKRPWLLEPAPLPDLDLRDASGGRIELARFLGQPWVLKLWSPDCARCLEELAEWRRERARGAALRVLALAAASPEGVERAAAMAREHGVEAAFAAEAALLPLAILVEDLVHWPRRLALPMSFLIDKGGGIVRLYEGAVPWRQIASDAEAIPAAGVPRLELALPFPGRYHLSDIERSEFQLGVSYLDAGLPGHALKAFERSLERRPGDIDALYNAGLIRLEAGELEAARRTFEAVVEARPDFADAIVNLGAAEARLGRKESAAERFRRAIALRPDHVEALLNAGNLALEADRVGEALEAFERAAALEPGMGEVQKRIGAVHRRTGRLALARFALERATRLSERDPEAWSNLGVILAESAAFEDAQRAFEKAIEVDAGYVSAYVNEALVLEALGRPAAVEDRFRAAIRIDPGHAGASINFARFLLRRGRPAEARKTLAALLEKVPGERQAKAMLEEIAE
jgi:tetratricopeptide (TPR) repeat protein